MNKKPGFTVQQHSVIKPQKHHFFIGEKHFINEKDDRSMTELIRLLQKEIVKPLHQCTKKVAIILVDYQEKFWVSGCNEYTRSFALLEKKKFISFIGVYLYSGVLFIIEMLIAVVILILKCICLALDKIEKYPLLAFLAFAVLLAWIFSKWKKFKGKKKKWNEMVHCEKRFPFKKTESVLTFSHLPH